MAHGQEGRGVSARIRVVRKRRWATIAAGLLGVVFARRRRRRRRDDVYFDEVPSSTRPIEGVGTSTAARSNEGDAASGPEHRTAD
jgi:hypothetical protein